MFEPKPLTTVLTIIALLLSSAACSNPSPVNTNENLAENKEAEIFAVTSANKSLRSVEKPNFTTKTIASFNEPWAMTALPKEGDESLKLLVTQKAGELLVVDAVTGNKTAITGVPKVAYGGQGGHGDVILAPDFATSNNIYLSYVEAGTGPDSHKFGAKVIKAKLSGLDAGQPSLQAIMPIWQQTPKMKGQGHYSHRLLFSPDGDYLYISSGERQEKPQRKI